MRMTTTGGPIRPGRLRQGLIGYEGTRTRVEVGRVSEVRQHAECVWEMHIAAVNEWL
jgi:hypothetical protein